VTITSPLRFLIQSYAVFQRKSPLHEAARFARCLGRQRNAVRIPRLIKNRRSVFTDVAKAAGIFSRGRQLHQRHNQGLTMIEVLKRFGKDQSGATAIEYGLIAAGIAVAIIATVQALGTQLNTTFSSVSTAIK
jgi:pilus assembly protein Flp/PilA